MHPRRPCAALWVVVALAVLVIGPAYAATVRQMNLEQMAGNAGQIFRGTVLDAREGTVRAGGGNLPTVTYILRVEEAFKGTFEVVKGQKIARIQMIGKLKTAKSGARHSVSPLPELPKLELGHDYLLLTTTPSAIGLSTTVGLAQGAFSVSGKPGQETAVNGADNLGLFAQSRLKTLAAAPAASGPIPYTTLANALRGIVGQ